MKYFKSVESFLIIWIKAFIDSLSFVIFLCFIINIISFSLKIILWFVKRNASIKMNLIQIMGAERAEFQDCVRWNNFVFIKYFYSLKILRNMTPVMIVRDPRASPLSLGYWEVDSWIRLVKVEFCDVNIYQWNIIVESGSSRDYVNDSSNSC